MSYQDSSLSNILGKQVERYEFGTQNPYNEFDNVGVFAILWQGGGEG